MLFKQTALALLFPKYLFARHIRDFAPLSLLLVHDGERFSLCLLSDDFIGFLCSPASDGVALRLGNRLLLFNLSVRTIQRRIVLYKLIKSIIIIILLFFVCL